jgi:hypothetical protein
LAAEQIGNATAVFSEAYIPLAKIRLDSGISADRLIASTASTASPYFSVGKPKRKISQGCPGDFLTPLTPYLKLITAINSSVDQGKV